MKFQALKMRKIFEDFQGLVGTEPNTILQKRLIKYVGMSNL